MSENDEDQLAEMNANVKEKEENVEEDKKEDEQKKRSDVVPDEVNGKEETEDEIQVIAPKPSPPPVIRQQRSYRRAVLEVVDQEGVIECRPVLVRSERHFEGDQTERQPTPRASSDHPTDPQPEVRTSHEIIRPIPRKLVYTPQEQPLPTPTLPVWLLQPTFLQILGNTVAPDPAPLLMPQPLPTQPLQLPAVLQQFLSNYTAAAAPQIPRPVDNIYNRPLLPPPYSPPPLPYFNNAPIPNFPPFVPIRIPGLDPQDPHP
ncbi:hypothetical protein CAEBREN_12444 [Caenorhabditis brenneri]|uniref:Uncharacterized protein n=1 Tax=Caenorhabditis brenneri TaxID=135651 RepID=G0MBN4_CAEBE|nr:hypothetical protein CAEBREN_12444 [Caenorhabditis brenneri]